MKEDRGRLEGAEMSDPGDMPRGAVAPDPGEASREGGRPKHGDAPGPPSPARHSEQRLSHVAPDGTARMVDVGAKPDTSRVARVTGQITMSPATLQAIVSNSLKKGDVLGVARVAGIMAAKRTAELIPLCHPVALTDVSVELVTDPALPGVRVEAVAKTVGKTGVEMEALTAATVTLLTIYDMAKALDRGMVIGDISLAAKSGGAGGEYARLDGTTVAP